MASRTALRFVVIALVLTAAACGGGDDEAVPTPTTAAQETDTGDGAGTETTAAPDTTSAPEPSDGDEPFRPSRDEMCAVVDGQADQLAAYAGIAEIEERTGAVLGRDCAVTSTSVGYVSLSLLPAITSDVQDAADGFDGVQSTSPGLVDGILIEDPAGLTQIAVFGLSGSVFQVQMESDGASTSIDMVLEAAIKLRFGLSNL